jgi:hypothetical protein
MARRRVFTLPGFRTRTGPARPVLTCSALTCSALALSARVLSALVIFSALVFSALVFSALVFSGPTAFADDPASGAPTTSEPTTAPPTAPPTTQAPTTVAPTTPVPTTPPTTPAEPTEPAPVVPTTPATTELPTITISPDNTGDSTPVWPWVLAGLGALVLIGGIIWFARSSSRRTDAAAAWRTRRLNAYAEGAALHDAILSATSGAAAPGLSGPPDQTRSDLQWAEIQRRANDLTQRLYQLRESAPDQDGQLRTERVLASLQALRSAMDTERASGPVHGMTADITRERLNDFRVSLYALRDRDANGPG